MEATKQQPPRVMIIWGDDFDAPRSPHWAGLDDHWFRPHRADAILPVSKIVEGLIEWSNWADATSACDTFFLTYTEGEEGADLEYVYGGKKKRIVSVDIKLPSEIVRSTSLAKVVGTLIQSALASIEIAAAKLSIPSPPLAAMSGVEERVGKNRVSSLRDVLLPGGALLIPAGPPRDRKILKEKLIRELDGVDHDVDEHSGVLCKLHGKVKSSSDAQVDMGDFIGSPATIEQLTLPEPVALVAFLSGNDFERRGTRLAQSGNFRRLVEQLLKMRVVATGRDNSVVWMTFCDAALQFDVEDFMGPGMI